MLAAIGDFLDALAIPLYQVGTLLGLNSSTAAVALGTEDKTIMTTWFGAAVGPFVEATGDLVVALTDIVLEAAAFLIALSGLM